jgi:hypothetical protein
VTPESAPHDPASVSLDDLLSALRAMTDAQRFDFADWALTQPDPTVGTDWTYRRAFGRLENPVVTFGPSWRSVEDPSVIPGARDAYRALVCFRDDGTVDERTLDDAFGHGREEHRWRAAKTLIWMLAVAILTGDVALGSRLRPAVEYLGLRQSGLLGPATD